VAVSVIVVLARERRPGHAEIVSVDGDWVRVANKEKVPKGKTRAPNIFIRPGAFSWYQGEVCIVTLQAPAKERRAPAMKELIMILSMRILAL